MSKCICKPVGEDVVLPVVPPQYVKAEIELDPNCPEHGDNRPKCSCFETPPWTWTTHYGAADPATQLEPNPECPVHFPAYAQHEKEVDIVLAGVDEVAAKGVANPSVTYLAAEVRRLRAERPDWDKIERIFRDDIAQEIEHLTIEQDWTPVGVRRAAAKMARVGWRGWDGRIL